MIQTTRPKNHRVSEPLQSAVNSQDSIVLCMAANYTHREQFCYSHKTIIAIVASIII